MSGMATWSGYVRLARLLDDLYRDDERRAADEAARREAVADALARLDHRLGIQRHRLEQLRDVLGEPLAPPAQAGPAPATDLGLALSLARQHADLADAQVAEVEQLAQQPPFLPGTAPTTRNLLVYAGCALIASVIMYVVLGVSNLTSLSIQTGTVAVLGSFCALPLLAWVAGYVATGVLGRPRVGDAEVDRNPRLGLLVCFLLMPLAFCGFLAVTALLSV